MRSLFKYGLVALWLIVIVTPPFIFLLAHGTEAFANLATAFPFFGLIAFTLIWSQIMLGAFMRPLEQLYPKIFPLHIIQGLTALIFAFIHPLLLTLVYWPHLLDVFHYDFVSPNLVPFVYLGEAGLILLICGVLAGLLRRWPPIQRYWHWLHLVNYLVFFLIFFHSWNVGGDLQTQPVLKGLWIFFFGTVLIGLYYRRIHRPIKEGLAASTQ